MKLDLIEEIHKSLLNGQARQVVSQIDDYGLYDFFADYKEYLEDMYSHDRCWQWSYFTTCVISYNRLKNR